MIFPGFELPRAALPPTFGSQQGPVKEQQRTLGRKGLATVLSHCVFSRAARPKQRSFKEGACALVALLLPLLFRVFSRAAPPPQNVWKDGDAQRREVPSVPCHSPRLALPRAARPQFLEASEAP
jgi:hypothetical protein